MIFSKNVSRNLKCNISNLLGLKELDKAVKYLGLPLIHSRRKGKDFEFVLDRLDSVLAGWKARTLSKAGRLTLIQSVGTALPIYAMQTAALPKQFCRQIDSRLMRFWWGHKNLKKGLCLRSWNFICRPKETGGLGIRKTQDNNLALIARWGWQLLTGKSSLCCNLLRCKYLRENNFLEVTKKQNDSWIWKSILSAQELVKKNCFRLVGDGKSINIWRDRWLPRNVNVSPTPYGTPRRGFMKVSDFVLNGKWNIPKLLEVFRSADVHDIISIRLSDNPDSWGWFEGPRGVYSAKAAYYSVIKD